ncbi:MAG: bifunctional 3-deoxy-7-phosphoheptulonate synthase/chorismate mutase type II [Ignavibacteriales bacterium]|jgi:chorismate mutase (EC 5.4.99.5)|nr:MAG: bifunctional 3-deoxy-7-phosphoheptulonate synthase/chorismate mutase type II [Ignavibacteriaceae bacterium]MBW7873388.1 bifunctional 3-deoxy-7-phosphoheptulonate synthase/chorismate mutase type II [Ignavibacteria bacterium]MCZ2142078.1 bifunctional 3-deoxy-7-phosphoheptulonate synthase/chorismate mutase type II [Ignavibacteriales bacterium]OQY71652.1 MAG: 3-deoxy-7-phosphoheptulonate synthase [Ignavibacteriales bacterium UTCHB3]MBV6444816.1 2-dehydro-3-deoxyphosphooctonate aldolase [Ign
MVQLLQKKPLIISGPCSAETEEQVIETATQLANTGFVDIMRAGIWKPRTRPGTFEGVGTKGLPWLQQARKITGIPLAVEVATSKQVEDALHFDVDFLWIGARSVVNPMSVQEIANALKGTKVPVFIKNPMNPDIELWSGAVERIANAGVENIGLIHRGFSTYGHFEYRNAPIWHLAIEMKRRYAELKMICDPSHIAGRRDLLKAVAQKAIDLDFDGLMIEVHNDPDHAWSDAKQQITSSALVEMFGQLVWRKSEVNPEDGTQIEQFRSEIDQIDDELMQLLSQRMELSAKIGAIKKEHNMTILRPGRWNEVFEKGMRLGKRLGLSHEFLTGFLEAVHMESINHQNRVMNA